MPIEPTILVIDGSDASRAALTHRIRKMGYRAMRAKTPEEAFAIVEEHRHQVAAALIPPDLAVADLAGALESLAARAPHGVSRTSSRARVRARSRSRNCARPVCAWRSGNRSTMRGCASRSTARSQDSVAQDLSRAEMRAPLDIPAHVIQAGRRKPARVYTLSSGGVYLDTERPSMRNAAIQVELDLWPSPVCAGGRRRLHQRARQPAAQQPAERHGRVLPRCRGGRVGSHPARRGRSLAPAHALGIARGQVPGPGKTCREAKTSWLAKIPWATYGSLAAKRRRGFEVVGVEHDHRCRRAARSASKSGPAKTTRPASASGFRFARCASRCSLRSSRPARAVATDQDEERHAPISSKNASTSGLKRSGCSKYAEWPAPGITVEARAGNHRRDLAQRVDREERVVGAGQHQRGRAKPGELRRIDAHARELRQDGRERRRRIERADAVVQEGPRGIARPGNLRASAMPRKPRSAMRVGNSAALRPIAGVAMPPGVPARTSAAVRCGCASANASPVQPPIDWQTSAARSTPAASRIAARSAAKRCGSSARGAQVERPKPR